MPNIIDRISEKGTTLDQLLDELEQSLGRITEHTTILNEMIQIIEQSDQQFPSDSTTNALLQSLELELKELKTAKDNLISMLEIQHQEGKVESIEELQKAIQLIERREQTITSFIELYRQQMHKLGDSDFTTQLEKVSFTIYFNK